MRVHLQLCNNRQMWRLLLAKGKKERKKEEEEENERQADRQTDRQTETQRQRESAMSI